MKLMLLHLLFVLNAAAITVGWEAPPGATSYTLYYGDTPRHYTNSVTSTLPVATITGLESEQLYYMAVTASNKWGESDFSEELIWLEPIHWIPVIFRVAIDKTDDLSGNWITITNLELTEMMQTNLFIRARIQPKQ